MDLAITNGHVYTPDGLRAADVGVRDGTIDVIDADRDLGGADRTLDADGGLVLPGLVNAHTHAAMTLLRGYADDVPLSTWLEELIWPVEAHLTDDDIAAGTALAALEMITTGTTAFGDMYFAEDRVAEVVEAAGIRARLAHGMITVGKDDERAREEVEQGIAFAEAYDGYADGRVRTMIAPHAPYTCAAWALEEATQAAIDLDLPLHMHLNETESEVEDILEMHGGPRPAHAMDDLGCWEPHGYVAHGVHLDASERELLAQRDVAVAHCPSANMKLASGFAPVPQLLEAGVTVGLGTDGAASNNALDMFTELRHAALLAKVAHDDAAAVPTETAIDMATRASASALDLPVGVLAEGRPADLVVLDASGPNLTPRHDLLSHAVYAATGADVCHTVCDGAVLMEDDEVLTMDEQRVIADAQAAAEDLIARAEG